MGVFCNAISSYLIIFCRSPSYVIISYNIMIARMGAALGLTALAAFLGLAVQVIIIIIIIIIILSL